MELTLCFLSVFPLPPAASAKTSRNALHQEAGLQGIIASLNETDNTSLSGPFGLPTVCYIIRTTGVTVDLNFGGA